jgi:hypothetical protein
MRLPPPAVCRKIRRLHAMAQSPVNENEARVARIKLERLLYEYRLTEADLPGILAATDDEGHPASQVGGSFQGPSGSTSGPRVNVYDLAYVLTEDHVSITRHERVAVTLWILHTYIFRQFAISPRLALLSPVPQCGKTTLLKLLLATTADPFKTDDPSPAALYHERDSNPYATFLVDEGDNLDLWNNKEMRRIFNAGYENGGSTHRFINGRTQTFNLFGPLAIAAIGKLPPALVSRSIVINMQRQPPGSTARRLDMNDLAFAAAREQIQRFAATCTLNPEPEMPPRLSINRNADLWRPLIAIADALGRGEAAREAAVALCAGQPDEAAGVILLADCRTAFDQRGIDRIWTEDLVNAVVDINEFWGEYGGLRGKSAPHKLRKGELAGLLGLFGIRPRSVWPLNRRPGASSRKGYVRKQFEASWRAYCSPGGTPAHSSKIRHLNRG